MSLPGEVSTVTVVVVFYSFVHDVKPVPPASVSVCVFLYFRTVIIVDYRAHTCTLVTVSSSVLPGSVTTCCSQNKQV